MGDREKRVGREFTRGGLGGRKRRGDLRRGIEGRGQGGVDSLPRTTNMAAGNTTYVSADYRNFSEFYLSG